ncbi:MAG TPA: AI-2E family transporter [Candidatus Binatia bacterium]|jgi:predicted PurR-regulated permease PerM|nr:AI-2E family transporter [Candidatus Binatia bacterium]
MRNEPTPTLLSWLIIILVTCLVLLVFQKILWLVIPGLLALVLYYCMQPSVQSLVRAGLRHGTAAKVVAGLLCLAMLLPALFILSVPASRAAAWKGTLAHYVQGGLDFLGKTEEMLAQKMPMLRKSAVLHHSPANLDAAAEEFAEKYLGIFLLQLVHWLPSLLLIPYLTYFLLREGNLFRKHLIRNVPNAYFEKTLLLFDRVDKSLQSFFVGLMKLTFLDTACLAIGLWLIGVSFPLLLGLVAAVLAWVPYLGSIVGCILVVVVAATDFPNEPAVAYGCILLFISVRILDDFLFLPLTVGRSLRIHPVLSVLVLFLGAEVAGPIGLMLVLPVWGVVAVVIESLGQILADQRLHERFRQARQLRAVTG